MTDQQIKKWFASRRKWNAWQQWTKDNGNSISHRTLRRALDGAATDRGDYAIQLAKQYIAITDGPSDTPFHIPQESFSLRA